MRSIVRELCLRGGAVGLITSVICVLGPNLTDNEISALKRQADTHLTTIASQTEQLRSLKQDVERLREGGQFDMLEEKIRVLQHQLDEKSMCPTAFVINVCVVCAYVCLCQTTCVHADCHMPCTSVCPLVACQHWIINKPSNNSFIRRKSSKS